MFESLKGQTALLAGSTLALISGTDSLLAQSAITGPAVTAVQRVLEDSVAIQLLDGKVVVGQLARISENSIHVKTNDRELTIELQDVVEIVSPVVRAESRHGDSSITLRDGSNVAFSALSFDEKECRLTQGALTHTFQVQELTSLSFIPLEGELKAEWDSLRERELESDVLILLDPDNNRLTEIDLVVTDLSDGKLGIIFDDAKRQITLEGRQKPIAGILFFQLPYERKEPAARVSTSNSTYEVEDISYSDNTYQITTVSGLHVALPDSEVERVDFSYGKFRHMSDLRLISSSVGVGIVDGETRVLHPQFNKSLRGGPLKLADQLYSHGLAIQAGTTMEFRIPRGFKRFVGIAGLDPGVRASGSVELAIYTMRGGEEQLVKVYSIAAADSTKEINVPIEDAQRLKIEVRPADNAFYGDYLNIGAAQLSK